MNKNRGQGLHLLKGSEYRNDEGRSLSHLGSRAEKKHNFGFAQSFLTGQCFSECGCKMVSGDTWASFTFHFPFLILMCIREISLTYPKIWSIYILLRKKLK